MAERITDAYVIGSESTPWTAARIEKNFTGKALIYCTRGTVTIAKHVEEVPPEPNADSPRILPLGMGGFPMIVDGDIWLYNADYGSTESALVHVIEYVE